MAKKQSKASVKISKTVAQAEQVKRELRNKARRDKRAQKKAMGDLVADSRSLDSETEHSESHDARDERNPVPHKPHTDKKFNFPKAKHANANAQAIKALKAANVLDYSKSAQKIVDAFMLTGSQADLVFVAKKRTPNKLYASVSAIQGHLVSVKSPAGAPIHERFERETEIHSLVLYSQPRWPEPKISMSEEFRVGDAVSHPAHGSAIVHSTTGTAGVINVILDKHQEFADLNKETSVELTEVHVDELTLLVTQEADDAPLRKRDPRVKDAAKAWKKSGFAIGMDVADKGAPNVRVGTLIGNPDVIPRDGMVGIRLPQGGGMTLSSLSNLVAYKEPKPVKPQKVAFKDVVLFGGFSLRNKTFVKVGNTSAIRIAIFNQHSENPSVYLASPEFRLATDAKTRFKVSDRVTLIGGLQNQKEQTAGDRLS